LPSALYCGWKAAGDEKKRERLVKMARTRPVNDRAVQLLGLNCPYLGFLPRPADALANVQPKISQSFRKKRPDPGDTLTFNNSHLESPSATLALHEELKAIGCQIRIIINVNTVPQPDPRLPCQPVRHLLWTFEGTEPRPGLPAPADAILQRVASLADSAYDYEEDWREARRLAQELRAEDIPQLLAAMIHPPPVPNGQAALDWLPRVQLSAAQIMAHIGTGWMGSPRRDGLFSALLGPRDWTTTAAIIALARLGSDDAAIASDVRAAFQSLEAAIPDGGYCCFNHALFANWQFLAGVPFEEAARVQKRLLEVEDQQGCGGR
jgi:hypothetical protein